MGDYHHRFPSKRGITDLYLGIPGTTYRKWTKERNSSLVKMTCVGSGAGGGAGLTGAINTNRGGGGAGGSGGVWSLLIPAEFVPDCLYVMASLGGLGGATSAAAGASGVRSFITARSGFSTAADLFLISGSVASAGGTGGTTAGAQAGGNGETVATNSLAVLSAWGVRGTPNAGQAGTAAGALNVAGTDRSWGVAGVPFSGGAGGGSLNTTNTDRAGGAVTGLGWIETVLAGIAAAGAGGHGKFYRGVPVFASSGGAGGGTAGAAGTAGRGGDAGPGSGGGGGGAGVTFGPGGNGGPGLIYIVQW